VKRQWFLDSSTFINGLISGTLPLILRLRNPMHFPEYVFRVELGLNAREETRRQAESLVGRAAIRIERLTVADLDKMAGLGTPRRIGLGEFACAILAERVAGGVLCDDRKAQYWLSGRLTIPAWETIEDVLIDAAMCLEATEYDLLDFQAKLRAGRYECRFELRLEFLQRRLNRGSLQ
jgi:hypothetical protein